MQCMHGPCNLLRFMVAEVGVGRPWGTGDWAPELILRASKGGLLEVAPAPAAPRGRAVLPIALAERVELPMKALPLVMPYSPSASPSKSSALSACCTHLKSITSLLYTLLCTIEKHRNIAIHLLCWQADSACYQCILAVHVPQHIHCIPDTFFCLITNMCWCIFDSGAIEQMMQQGGRLCINYIVMKGTAGDATCVIICEEQQPTSWDSYSVVQHSCGSSCTR